MPILVYNRPAIVVISYSTDLLRVMHSCVQIAGQPGTRDDDICTEWSFEPDEVLEAPAYNVPCVTTTPHGPTSDSGCVVDAAVELPLES